MGLVLSFGLVAACGDADVAAGPQGRGGANGMTNPDLARVADEPWRALWITRFDFRTEADVRRAIALAGEAGFNRILFQVRGNATVMYESALEPWAEQLGVDELGGQHPGYDPLAVALDAAHARGMELHAWVNVMPAWWGTEPPKDPEQLWNARPDWAWYDQSGARAPLVPRFYASVNPCLPDVRAYLREVLRELLRAYPIDGLHLDYVRFPNESPVIEPGSGIDYPRDERTLALYRDETGLAPDDDPAAWTDWRCGCVTQVVRDARGVLEEERPGIWLTAAVAPDPTQARASYFQDSERWFDEGLLDAALPMNYASNDATYRARLDAWATRARDRGVPVVMGISGEGPDPRTRSGQVQAARDAIGGFSLFAFASLFDGPNETTTETDEATKRLRRERREAIVPLVRDYADWDRQTTE